MREWNLRPGDPLALTLAADFRLCKPDPGNDQVWELELGGGDPAAISVRTTYGLRARSMRIFPKFIMGGREFCDPEGFTCAPCVRAFAPNYLEMDYEPIPGLHVNADIWVPDSQTIAGRFTITNRLEEPRLLRLALCSQLSPMEGEGFRNVMLQSVNILSGKTVDLVPVIFLTGGPTPVGGAHPALMLDLALAPGGERSLTWVSAALGNQADSFEHARRTAARPWETEKARLELVNQAHIVDVQCGDPDWEAAFALSQKQALSLFLPAMEKMPEPVFVTSRQADHGWIPTGKGSATGYPDRSPSAQDCHYMANVLPGSPELAVGLVRNFLVGQGDNGKVSWKAGSAGNQGNWLAAPWLAGLAWDACRRMADLDFAREVLPGLEKFLDCWLDEEHDRDGDGLPEWEHPLQAGMEGHALQNGSEEDLPGGDITCVETPALGALLYHEYKALAGMAGLLGLSGKKEEFLQSAAHLAEAVEGCWNESKKRYQVRDRDSHRSPAGRELISLKGPGNSESTFSFPQPTRLVLQVALHNAGRRDIMASLPGGNDKGSIVEVFSRQDFDWFMESGTATSHSLFTAVESLRVEGLETEDRVSLRVMDFSYEDISQFLPLWAGIPGTSRAEKMVKRSLLDGKYSRRLFGIPSKPGKGGETEQENGIVALPWNAMIAEGLARYGMQEEAVRLMGSMMGAVVASLKQQKAFLQYHQAQTGAGRGERNAVQGLAPLGTFLKILGVEFCPPGKVILSGKNPYPWPVTVKYRGITVTRQAENTEVTFPGGQCIKLSDPTHAVVEAE